MVQKLRDAKLQVLPYVEVIIKPADVRPITFVIMDSLTDVDVSVGTADDMAEAITIFGVLRAVAASLCNVRLMAEAARDGISEVKVEGDEGLPF